MVADQQVNNLIQGLLYDLINLGGRRALKDVLTPNLAMAIAIYATPYVTVLADKAILDAKTTIYKLQVYFFLNRELIYNTFEHTSNINTFDSGYVLNLNIGDSTDAQAAAYRESLAPSVQDRLIIFNMIGSHVCILAPFLSKPITGDVGTSNNMNNFLLIARLNSCVLTDLSRKITYTFSYDSSGLNKIIYSDAKNGWTLTFSLTNPPTIEKIQ